MIKDSTDDEIEKRNDRVDFKTMILLSIIGVKIGNRFGDKFQNKAEPTGGIILIIIGLKILLEHLGIIAF